MICDEVHTMPGPIKTFMWFRVKVLRLRVWGFRVEGLRLWVVGLRTEALGFRAGLGFGVGG